MKLQKLILILLLKNTLQSPNLNHYLQTAFYNHKFSISEKLQHLTNLKTQIKEASNTNSQISNYINSAQNYYNSVKDLKEKVMNPSNFIKDTMTDGVKNIFNFRRLIKKKRILADLDVMLNDCGKKIIEGKTNQKDIQVGLDGAYKGVRDLEKMTNIFSDDNLSFWEKIKKFFSDFFKKFSKGGDRRLLRNFEFQGKSKDEIEFRILEKKVIGIGEEVSGVEIRRLVDESGLSKILKKLVESVVVSMQDIKSENKRPIDIVMKESERGDEIFDLEQKNKGDQQEEVIEEEKQKQQNDTDQKEVDKEDQNRVYQEKVEKEQQQNDIDKEVVQIEEEQSEDNLS